MPSQTRSSLTTLIGLLIDDPQGRQFSASQKQDKIQEAQERFVLDTRVLTDNVTDTSVAGTQEYALQSDVLDIKRLAHRGIPLIRQAKFDIDLMKQADWSADAGTPKWYYVDPDPNNKKYGLYPIPQSGDAGANLAVEYIKIPPTLSADASVPFDGHALLTPYHNAIAYWAAAELLVINPTQERIAKAIAFKKRYEDEASHCIETFRHLTEPQQFRMRSIKEGKGL